MKRIEIIIASNSQTKIETKGFVGAECRQASQFIEKALGQQTDEVLKAEFHSMTSAQSSLQCGEKH
jgi:hypothetical protein